jgi:hypothetical protein
MPNAAGACACHRPGLKSARWRGFLHDPDQGLYGAVIAAGFNRWTTTGKRLRFFYSFYGVGVGACLIATEHPASNDAIGAEALQFYVDSLTTMQTTFAQCPQLR